MELNDIKNLWAKENPSETPEISLEKLKEIRMPLEKIRYNMRMEFWMTILIFPLMFIGLFSILKYYQPQQIFHLASLLMVMALIVIYYFLKFFSLYQRINTQDFKTFHHLLNLRYELVLNTEHYKSYYLAFVPVYFAMFLVMYSPVQEFYSATFMLVVSFVICCAVLFIIGRVWLKEMYGKHIVQISDLVSSLTNEQDDFEFNRNALMSYNRFGFILTTEKWFLNKFGLKGKILNTIFWTVVGLLLLIVFSIALGYGIGHFAQDFNRMDLGK